MKIFMRMYQAINYSVRLKGLVLMVLFAFWGLSLSAQPDRKPFNPARFEADLEQFITVNAGLTPEEAAKFFPLYRELRKRQLGLMQSDRRYAHVDVNDDKACKEAIRKHDNNDIEIKELLKTYHEKFMRVMPASKVYRVIQAEDKFHRQLFKRASGRKH